MDSNTTCVCCDKKLSRGNKRLVIMKALLIFVSARLFPSSVLTILSYEIHAAGRFVTMLHWVVESVNSRMK